ncbi:MULTISPECIES: hypothetical protein [unclassified Microcoleus]
MLAHRCSPDRDRKLYNTLAGTIALYNAKHQMIPVRQLGVSQLTPAPYN